jgi:hypothetical protein
MSGENRFNVGKTFLSDVLSHLPAELRGAVEETFSKPEAQGALGALGDGVLRQADYTRLANDTASRKAEVDAHYAELNGWFEENKALLELGKAAKAGAPTPTPATPAAKPAPTGVTREELEKTLYEREQGVVSFMDVANAIRDRHFDTFGERITVASLVADPKVKELGLEGAYNAKYGDKYREKDQKARDAEIEKRVNERVAEERRKWDSRPPYPIAPSESSPLDTLSVPADQQPKGDLIDRATQHYDQLAREKLTATT